MSQLTAIESDQEVLETVPADESQPLAEEDVQPDRVEEFIETCRRFDRCCAEMRQALLKIIDIPLTPSLIIAVTIGCLVRCGIVPIEAAYLGGVANGVWTMDKIQTLLRQHHLSKIAVSSASDYVQNLLACSSGRERFELEGILRQHVALRDSVAEAEFRRTRERSASQQDAEIENQN